MSIIKLFPSWFVQSPSLPDISVPRIFIVQHHENICPAVSTKCIVGSWKTEGRGVAVEWIWITQSKNRQRNQDERMGERQKDLMESRLLLSAGCFKERRCHMHSDTQTHAHKHAHTYCVCWRPEQAGPGIQSLTKGHSNTFSPHNLFRAKLQFTNSAGLHLMWPRWAAEAQSALCLLLPSRM